jgi:hypothetical protein
MAQAMFVIHPDICVPVYQNNKQAVRRFDGQLPTIANIADVCHGQTTTFHPLLPHLLRFVQNKLFVLQ